ncbi:hypothetical protein [Parasphingorhabdus sp.]|uniref:hypothetical protein n=1 Tax=Parasphingorhabdus sp. TaxID=2709688 RepID=UPI0032ED1E6C
MQSFTSHAYWTCPECDETNDQQIEVPELNFAAEKSSEMGVDDSTDIVCEHCDTEFSGHVWVNMGETSFEMEEPHKFSFSGDIPMYGPDEYDYDPPEDPHSIAREALAQLSSMVGTPGPANDTQFTNRLVFAGAVSSLEAYLGDTLINAVQDEVSVRDQLLTKNSILGSVKVTAAEMASDQEIMTKRIVQELRGYLYHNLSAVTALYKDAFDIDLAPSKAQRDLLFQAMPRRHDCVHRNGRNQEGEKQTDFTDEYVETVIKAIVSVVDHIEVKRLDDLPF